MNTHSKHSTSLSPLSLSLFPPLSLPVFCLGLWLHNFNNMRALGTRTHLLAWSPGPTPRRAMHTKTKSDRKTLNYKPLFHTHTHTSTYREKEKSCRAGKGKPRHKTETETENRARRTQGRSTERGDFSDRRRVPLCHKGCKSDCQILTPLNVVCVCVCMRVRSALCDVFSPWPVNVRAKTNATSIFAD